MHAPDGWSHHKISEILERVSDPIYPESEENYRQIGIRSHGKGLFHKKPVTGKSLGNKRVFRVHPDCLVVNIVFAWEQAIAKTTVSEIGMIASHRFPMFQPKDNLCDIDYLTYFFNTPRGKYLLGLASPGGAGRNKTLGQNEFARLTIIIPPTEEQKKIAQILSCWDKAIEKLEALIAARQKRKKALMQQLLTGKKRFAGFVGEWNKLCLNDLIEIHYGRSPSEVKDENGAYCIIGTGGIRGKAKIFLCDKPAIVIGRKGTIDKPILIAEPFWPIDTTFYCLPKKNTDLVWLLGQLKRMRLERLNESTGLPSLSRDNLYSLKIQTPPLPEQQKIASVFSTVDKEIETHKNQLDALKEQKKGQMQQLLTGKKRVKIDEATS